MKPLTIGQVAQRSGMGIETVRFYEREGLLAKPARAPSGYRQFDGEVVNRLRLIQRAKELGFTLKEIKELLSLRVAPGTSCEQIKRRTVTKIENIEGRIRTLQRMKRALQRLVAACSTKGSVSICPILDALDNNKR